mgnify:CR=1 FL=1
MPRLEHDFLGEMRIPSDTYYGIQTYRAVENFPISGVSIASFPELIKRSVWSRSLGHCEHAVRRAAPRDRGRHLRGLRRDHRGRQVHGPVPRRPVPGGAGTSVNMNANEVIANLALEILGEDKGRYDIINPNDHVNRSQSTNDATRRPFASRCGAKSTACARRWMSWRTRLTRREASSATC